MVLSRAKRMVAEKYKNRDPYKKLVNHGKTPPPNIDGEFLHEN